MSVQTKHRFSIQDYYRMAETGVLPPDARVELFEGGIIRYMSPIGPFHGGVVARLTRLFTRLANDRWLVWPQNPIRVNKQSELQPDVALLRPSTDDYTSCIIPGPGKRSC